MVRYTKAGSLDGEQNLVLPPVTEVEVEVSCRSWGAGCWLAGADAWMGGLGSAPACGSGGHPRRRLVASQAVPSRGARRASRRLLASAAPSWPPCRRPS